MNETLEPQHVGPLPMQQCPTCGELVTSACPWCEALLLGGDRVLTDWTGERQWADVLAPEDRVNDWIPVRLNEQVFGISRAYVLEIQRRQASV